MSGCSIWWVAWICLSFGKKYIKPSLDMDKCSKATSPILLLPNEATVSRTPDSSTLGGLHDASKRLEENGQSGTLCLQETAMSTPKWENDQVMPKSFHSLIGRAATNHTKAGQQTERHWITIRYSVQHLGRHPTIQEARFVILAEKRRFVIAPTKHHRPILCYLEVSSSHSWDFGVIPTEPYTLPTLQVFFLCFHERHMHANPRLNMFQQERYL